MIFPSLLPPFVILSNSARAMNPLGLGVVGWGVEFPNNSLPPSIVPLPFLSNTNQASSELAIVQDRCSGVPSLLRSKLTPPAQLVKVKPLPTTSISTGVAAQQQPLKPLGQVPDGQPVQLFSGNEQPDSISPPLQIKSKQISPPPPSPPLDGQSF